MVPENCGCPFPPREKLNAAERPAAFSTQEEFRG